jgi:hypothetical protein
MAVFRNYKPTQAGAVSGNAHPNVHSYPWVPNNSSIRSSGTRVGWTERVQPQERGRTWGRSSVSVGASLGTTTCGCGRNK